MFIAKRLLETNVGVFKKDSIVPDEVAKKYWRYVTEVEGELLTETPSEVEVIKEEVQDIKEEVQDLKEEKTEKVQDIKEEKTEKVQDIKKEKQKEVQDLKEEKTPKSKRNKRK